jgi:hypothetical protein
MSLSVGEGNLSRDLFLTDLPSQPGFTTNSFHNPLILNVLSDDCDKSFPLGHLNTCPSTQQEPLIDFPEMLKETSAELKEIQSEIAELKRQYNTEEDPIQKECIKFILEITSKELDIFSQNEQSLLTIVAQEKFLGSS